MLSWLAWLIAAVCAVAFLSLWFWEVRRIMRTRKSTVESAASQLAVCRKKAVQAKDDPDAAAVLERSEQIYRQASNLYNKTLHKPWMYLPAHLMGFKCVP